MTRKLQNAYQVDIYYKDENGVCDYKQVDGTFKNTCQDESIVEQMISARMADSTLNEQPFDVKIIYSNNKYYLKSEVFVDVDLILENEDEEIIELVATTPETILEISIHLEEI